MQILPPVPASGPALAKTPDVADIVRKAEEFRSPELDYAVDFTIGVLDNYTPGVERRAAYTMIARGKDRSMVLMLTPEQFYGGTLLMDSGNYWLLLPKATKTFQLSSEQVIRGDIGNGDLARINLLGEYEASIDGGETIGKDACWRIEFKPRSGEARYSRIRAWIGKKKLLPLKYEYYGLTGALLKTARYEAWEKTALGLRSMRLVIDSPGENERRTTMIFTNLRKIDPSPLRFTPEGMVDFRDAALARRGAGDEPARLEEILAALPGAD